MEEPSQSRRSRTGFFSRKTGILLLGILLLGTFLRCYNLGSESFWIDEVITVQVSEQAFPQLLSNRLHRGHSPLYFMLMHYWLRIAGEGEAAARFPSVVFGIASICLLFLLAKVLFNSKVALMSSLLLAVSQMNIHYSQEARMYSAVVFFTLLSTLFLVRALEDRKRIFWVGYVISSAINLFLSASAILALPVHGLYVVLAYRGDRENLRSFLRSLWGLSFLAVPLLLALVGFSKGRSIVRVPPGSFSLGKGLVDTFAHFASVHYLSALKPMGLENLGFYALIFFFVLLLGSMMGLFKKKRAKELTLVFLWLWIPSVLLFGLSFMIWPRDRYLLLSSCALYILLAVFLCGMRNRKAAAFLCAVIVALSLTDVALYYQVGAKPPWREIALYVRENSQIDEKIFVCPRIAVRPFRYYYEGTNKVMAIQKSSESLFGFGAEGGWLVVRRSGPKRKNIFATATVKTLDRHFSRSDQKIFRGGTMVFRYARLP